jgi:hypothetical protein
VAAGEKKGELETRLRAVFTRQPALHRFVVQDRASIPDHTDKATLDGELFVTQITLYPKLGLKQYDEVYADIARAITQVVAEVPGARNLLPGRVFVRSIH